MFGMLIGARAIATVLILIGGIIEYRSQISDVRDTLDTITGGDSYTYLAASTTYDNMHRTDFELIHEGQHPVYDVQITVYRTDDKWLLKPDGKYIQRPERFSVPVMSPGHMPAQLPTAVVTWHPDEHPEPPETSRLIAVISARNGYFVQYLRLGNDAPNWVVDSVVLESGELGNVRRRIGDFDALLNRKLPQKVDQS